MNDSLYRIYHCLDDGRRIYFTFRGRPELVPAVLAEGAVELWKRQDLGSPTADRWVYSADLGKYGELRRDFDERDRVGTIAVVGMGMEREDEPIRTDAFLFGGTPAVPSNPAAADI